MGIFRCFHEFNQHTSHILGVEEDYGCSVSADSRLAENTNVLRLHIRNGFVNIRDFKSNMMLSALGVLL